MSRLDLIYEMCYRIGLNRWYGTRLMAKVIIFEGRTGKKVSKEELAYAVKFMGDNRQYLIAPQQ